MIHTRQLDGIRLNIQTVDLTINRKVKHGIREMIKKLQRHIEQINWADIHLKEEGGHATDHRMVSVRLGIPCNDVFASYSGNHWLALIRKVEDKLKRQLNKRKG